MSFTKNALLAICALTLLTGCFETRKNPLLEKDTDEVVQWLFANTDREIENCAQSWVDPKAALPSSLKICESVGADIVTQINYVGFAQNVQIDDLSVPIIWRAFNERVQSRNERDDSLKQQKEEEKERGYYLIPSFNKKEREKEKNGLNK